MNAQEQAEARMMDILQQRVAGVDQYGNSLSQSDHQAAIRQYEELKQRRDARKEAEARISIEQRKNELEADRIRIEADRQRAAADAELRRIELEAERVQVQKAEVVVKMLEVAQKGGVQGHQLLKLISGMSDRLLTSGERSSPIELENLLTDREEK